MVRKISLWCMLVAMIFSTMLLPAKVYAASDYTNGITVSGTTATIWFKSNVNTSWVDVHYTINSGDKQNIRMTYNASTLSYEQKVTVAKGDSVTYSFTYNNGTPAYDTETFKYSVGATDGGTGTNPVASSSIYSIQTSSIPAPTGNGVMSLKMMNGSNGKFADNQIYWAVIGKIPGTETWCYLDLNGNLVPISTALNDASGHLTKNGQNYANIYHKVSDASWVSLPKITSGRMFISMGSTCYIKTYDNGFAGPDINNTSDPNNNVYFDFIEFTVNDSGYHGNTTRVDQFGFPVQHRLVNKAGNYDKTVGELESETRNGIFEKYKNEVPNEFKSLATLQAPYRIVCPISGPFKEGGAYANYFAGYSNISTRDILLGIGGAATNVVCAALNRHVYENNNDWNNVSAYYKAGPANYYAKFWHDHSINGLAYGFCYDDVNGQASYLEVGDPKGLIIRAGW